MTRRTVSVSVFAMGCALILSGGLASAEDLAPLAPVPADYTGKHMPAGGLTDPKAIEEGGKIYRGEFNTDINCASCHGKDGKPVKKGACDLRDQKNTTQYSDSYWFWRVSEGGSQDKDEGLEGTDCQSSRFGKSSPISTCTRTTGSRLNIQITSHNPSTLI